MTPHSRRRRPTSSATELDGPRRSLVSGGGVRSRASGCRLVPIAGRVIVSDLSLGEGVGYAARAFAYFAGGWTSTCGLRSGCGSVVLLLLLNPLLYVAAEIPESAGGVEKWIQEQQENDASAA